MKKINYIYKDLIILCCCYLLIILVSIKNYLSLEMPSVVNDEFGYWLSAAFFTGKDWNSIAQGVAYYSYGYGIILGFLMSFISNYVHLYQCALLLNVIWLCLSYGLLIRICGSLNEQMTKRLCYLICLVITLCSSNICFLNYTLPEIFLFFLSCSITWTFICVLKRKNIRNYIFLATEILFAYIVHQRMIVFLLMASIIILYLFFKKKLEIKYVLVYLASVILLFIITSKIKSCILTEIWNNNAVAEGNNYSGQIDKIIAIFTQEGAFSFLQNICGRVIYIMISTFGMGYIAFVKFLDDLILFFKRKKEINLVYVFVIGSTVASIFVSAIFLLYPDHTTHIFYGRYTENYYGPLMILGVGEFYENQSKALSKNKLGVTLTVLTIGIFFLKFGCKIRNIPISNYAINSVSFSWLYQFESEKIFYLVAIILIDLLIVFGGINLYNNRKILLRIMLVSIFFLQLMIGREAYTNFKGKYFDNLTGSTKEVCKIINQITEKSREEIDVYVVDDNSGVFCAGAPIQFVLNNQKITYFEDEKSINGLDENSILLVVGHIEEVYGMRKVKECGLYKIWIKDGNEKLSKLICE